MLQCIMLTQIIILVRNSDVQDYCILDLKIFHSRVKYFSVNNKYNRSYIELIL